MRIKTIYIDDDEIALERYKTKFEVDERSKNKFDVIPWSTPKSPEDYDAIGKENPELILVDFDLSIPDAEGKVIGISGVTLSTELRQKFPEIPIVLFTRKSVFKIQVYSDIKQTLSSIDEIIYKNDLFKPDKPFLENLYELAIGFKKLRESESKMWDDLLKIVKAPERDYEKLKRANPPLPSGKRSVWSVSEAANWIQKILINYPGILYNSIHSATFLGISEKAFLAYDVQDFFKEAKYSGIFKHPEGRWWKSKLLEIATSQLEDDELSLPVRKGFPIAWERINNTTIEKSKCISSGESPAEWVCYILKKPVMIKDSLAYNPDSRPSVMDEARVSFKAIRTSNEVNDELFDSLGQELLEKIRKMPKRG